MAVKFGEPHEHHAQIDSTNARAKELARGGAPGGLVVTADEQTAGRGRQGRDWFAPPGGALLYSALLRPLGDRPLLPLAVPLAVCETAENLANVECGVKWPNDVWVRGRKLAGILIEGRPEEDWAVIGVGLNVDVPAEAFPDELRDTATSLEGVRVSGGAGGAQRVAVELDRRACRARPRRVQAPRPARRAANLMGRRRRDGHGRR